VTRAVSILAVLILCGCAHKARKYSAPDTTMLRQKQAEAATHVRAAKGETARASASIAKARTSHIRAVESHRKETVSVTAVAEKLSSPVWQNVPIDLRDAFDAVQQEVSTLVTLNHETSLVLAEITPQLDGATVANAAAAAALIRAESAQGEIELKFGPAYISEVDTLTEKLNTAEEAWAKNSAQIVKMKTASWTYRIVGLVGALAVVALLFLWFTGKLAIGAANIVK
jgi:hypothetical protein